MNQTLELQRKQINIAIVGPVSAGKSTLMNALFANQYSDMKIKRTTMTPQIYLETNNQPKDMVELSKEILENNREVNQTLMKKSESNEKILQSDIAESKYFIPRVHKLVKMPSDVYLTIYDIPGLNDSQTKNIYFQYVNENFYKFDLVIFVIDINSALNTSDEVDILKNIISNSKDNFQKYSIENKLIILANKCDTLRLGKDDKLIIEEEYQEMFDQIKTIVNAEVTKIFPQLQYNILPISCEDSYIYRMCNRDPNMDLDLKHANKFGYNEYGRSKWDRLGEDIKKDKIKKLMSEINIDEVLKVSGFLDFRIILNKYLSDDEQIKYLLNRIYYDMTKINKHHQLDISGDINDFYVLKCKIEEIYNSYTSQENESKSEVLNNVRRFIFYEKDDKINISSTPDCKKITDKFNNYIIDYLNKYHQNVIKIEISKVSNTNLEQIHKIKKNMNKLLEYFPQLLTGKLILQEVNDALNAYYISNIENPHINIQTGIKYLYDLISNKFKVTFKLIDKLFSNADLKNLTALQIVNHLIKLRNDGLIKKSEQIDICVKTLLSIYSHILDGTSIGYITQDSISSYAYIVDDYWSNWNSYISNVSIDEKLYNKILQVKFLAKKIMVACINLNRGTNSGTLLNISIVLEEYLTSIILDDNDYNDHNDHNDYNGYNGYNDSDDFVNSSKIVDSDFENMSNLLDEIVVCGEPCENMPYKLREDKYRKKPISKSLKRDVWHHHVGRNNGTCKCFCCKLK
jgi:small GTP-binding protein